MAVTAAALAKAPMLPTWGTASVAGAAFLVGLVSDPFRKVAAEWIERPSRRHGVFLAATRAHDRKGRLQRVRDCTEPLVLGVHAAAHADDGSATDQMPPYVRRDVHDRLTQKFEAGGIVIIEGASAAGKSRLAFEAIHAYASDRWLIVPAEPGSLRVITRAGVVVRNAVVWLDDVENYLASDGLDGAVLDALCPSGVRDVLIVATLRSEARNELTGKGLETTTARAVEDVMRRAGRPITLDRELTERERARAKVFRSDSRIAAALDQTSGAGFAEYLAAGPATLARWESATRGENLTAGAIISAAVDARRAGHLGPISRDLLARLHSNYLTARDQHRSDRPDFDQALTWATEPVKGASGCLNPAGVDTFRPFDYLVDHVQRTTSVHQITAPVWAALMAHAPTSEMVAIGILASHAGHPDISKGALRRAIDAGDTGAMFDLGVLLEKAGRADEAERWFRVAADAGHTGAMSSMGILLAEAKRIGEAEKWFRRLADTGNTGAMYNLGRLLAEAGRPEEAEKWYRHVADSGDTDAMINLAVILTEAGRPEEAEKWYRRAANSGDTHAMYNLGNLLAEAGRPEEAEKWYRRAADSGYADAMNNLGVLLDEAGRAEEAEKWYRRAADTGESVAMYNLGRLLAEAGRAEEAEKWYRRAHDK